MEWRDVAMIMIGIVGALNMLLYNEIKAAIMGKADKDHIDEDRRRLTDHDKDIGTIYSKMYDGQIKSLTAINDNQKELLRALAAVVGNHGASSES